MSESESLQDKIKAMNSEYEKKQKTVRKKKPTPVAEPPMEFCQPKMATRDKILVAVSIVEVAFYVLAIVALIKFIAS